MKEVAQNADALAIDARAKECVRFARELSALKVSDRTKFDEIVAKLRKAVIEEADTSIGDMATATLEELQIDSTEGLTLEQREELFGVLLKADDDCYMGGDERFVPLDDARSSGELGEI